MHKCPRRCLLTIPVLLCSILSCSGPDDSTGLGAGIIEEVYPGRVTIDKHIREYSMNSTSCDSSFSIPGPGDTAFGIHPASDSNLVIGAQGNERAAAYVRFVPRPDTASLRIYSINDSPTSIVVRFFCDSAAAPRNVVVEFSTDSSFEKNPGAANRDTLLGTMRFIKDTNATVTDSVVITGRFKDSIFASCTTTIKDSSKLAQRPVIGFILMTQNASDPVLQFDRKPSVSVKFTRDSADTFITYFSNFKSFYLTDDGNPDSLQRIPALSYASKRTAVFRYSADSLWSTITAMDNQEHAQILSAVFKLKGYGDTLNLRYLLLDKLERNGARLDSAFAAASAKQSAVSITDTSRVLANVLTSLQNFTLNGRPPALYLYLRFGEDLNQKWKQTVWQGMPLLSAMIAVP